jgi:hypothetical protein
MISDISQSRLAAAFNGRFIFFWHQRAILDLAARDIDHELGELGGIARAFESLLWHGASMHRLPSRFQRTLN